MAHAWLWDTEEGAQLSDLELQLVLAGSSDAPPRVLHLHKVVLGGASPYFRAQVTSWAKNQARQTTPGGDAPEVGKRRDGMNKNKMRRLDDDGRASNMASSGASRRAARCQEVTETYDTPEQRDAALAVLELAYGRPIPETCDADAVFNMVLRADYWGMEACAGACLQRLAQRAGALASEGGGKQRVEEECGALTKFCTWLRRLPENVLVSAEARGLVAQVKGLACRTLPSAREILDPSGHQHRAFLALPDDILLHWLARDELVVDGEDTVACLLHAWIREGRYGRASSHDTRKRLFGMLRPHLVSTSFAVQMMPAIFSSLGLTFADLPDLAPMRRVIQDAPKLGTRVTCAELQLCISATDGKVLVNNGACECGPWHAHGLRWVLMAQVHDAAEEPARRTTVSKATPTNGNDRVQIGLYLRADSELLPPGGVVPTSVEFELAGKKVIFTTLKSVGSLKLRKGTGLGCQQCLPEPIKRHHVADLFENSPCVAVLRSVM